MSIVIRENFILKDQLKRLQDQLPHRKWPITGESDSWSGRSSPILPLDPLGQDGLDILRRIRKEMCRTTGKILYPDTIALARWRVGESQRPHADGEESNGDPHRFYPWREYGSVIYLNSDYEGGTIYFPQHDLEVKPEPGTLVYFPGTAEYLHGVNEVTSGIRYTLNMFWTQNKEKSVLW